MTNEEPHYDYPRTRHLPWSPGGSKDDLRLSERDPETMKQGWQRDYMQGRDVDGAKTSDHQTRLHLKEFEPSSESADTDSGKNSSGDQEA